MAAANPHRPSHDQIVDLVLAEAGGDVRAALSDTLAINRKLMVELRELAGRRAYERLRSAA